MASYLLDSTQRISLPNSTEQTDSLFSLKFSIWPHILSLNDAKFSFSFSYSFLLALGSWLNNNNNNILFCSICFDTKWACLCSFSKTQNNSNNVKRVNLCVYFSSFASLKSKLCLVRPSGAAQRLQSCLSWKRRDIISVVRSRSAILSGRLFSLLFSSLLLSNQNQN